MLKTKLAYACGDIYGGGSFLIFSMLFMNFLVIVENLPVVLATIIIFVGRITDAFADPIMGSLSDRTKSRFGRRRVYFLAGMAPVFISFIMIWYAFGITGTMEKFIYFMAAYILFGFSFTLVMVPYNAILPEMTGDYNERTRYTTVRMAFSAGTSVLGAIIPSMIIRSAGGNVNGPAQQSGYLYMALIFGVVFGACWLFVFLGTRERKDLPPPDSFSIKNWFTVWKNKSYRIFLGIFVFVQLTIDLLLALFVFYMDIVILQYKNYEVVMGTLLVFQLLFMFLHNRIAQKKGKHFPLIIGIPIWIVTLLAFIFISAETPLIVLCILAACIALGAAAGNLATWSMISDIYDVDELMTTKRREGIYSGFTTFIRKFTSGIAILLLGFGLQFAGFDSNQYNVERSSAGFDPSAYSTSTVAIVIKWMFIIIPVVLLVMGLLFTLRYKLDAKRFGNLIGGIEKLKKGQPMGEFSADEKADFELLTGKPVEQLWQSPDEMARQKAQKAAT